MSAECELTPKTVPHVLTAHRRIVTPIPPPESLPLLEQLRREEPRCMTGQPPIVWETAEGFLVRDPYGNQWIDFSSGVLITNAGHGRKEIADAITAQAQAPLLTSYCFPNRARAALVHRLVELSPPGLDNVFLLSTGSETVECAIKLGRARGISLGGHGKTIVVSFDRAFHGRTLGSQMIGGFPALKEWIANLDPGMVQVPFPDGYHTPDTDFGLFERTLEQKRVAPEAVCAVIMETYQGSGASFAPAEYVRELRRWCDAHDAVLVMDEVQAGFGRTGPFWGFEHYGIVPDLMCLGKGISSSLPISAIIGRRKIMDLFGPGSMTSTHSGNPVCCAAALANIELLLAEDLPGNSRRVGEALHKELGRIAKRFEDRIGAVHGKGLAVGIHCRTAKDGKPDGELARKVVEGCVERGVMLFNPVGVGGSTIKICPPLCITEDASLEAAGVVEEAFEAALD
ncbi:MAG TPA: aspartate aminotransferase family protein [Candidatus Brocadiia bacterium]|nr:aspartate aminotransferase family protein [Candidatus Brocadiia bacterium]